MQTFDTCLATILQSGAPAPQGRFTVFAYATAKDNRLTAACVVLGNEWELHSKFMANTLNATYLSSVTKLI